MVWMQNFLGGYLPWQRSVCCLSVSMIMIIYLRNTWVIPFPRSLRAQSPTRDYHLYVLKMLIVNFAEPTKVNEVSLHFTFFLDITPALFSPASLIYHQWISHSSSYATSNKQQKCHYPEHYFNPVRFHFWACPQKLAQIKLLWLSKGWTSFRGQCQFGARH